MKQKGKPSLREISDITPPFDGSSFTDLTQSKEVFTYVNDQFCKISKYSHEEFLEQIDLLFDSGLHPKKFFRKLLKTAESGKTWCGDIKTPAKDGSFYRVSTTIVPFPDEQGKHQQYFVIRHDITNRKLIQEKLREEEILLDGILNSITAQVAVLDQNGIIIHVNKSWTDYTLANGGPDYLAATGIGTNYLDVCYASGKDLKALAVAEGIKAVLRGDKTQFAIEYPCNSQIENRWFLLTITPLSYGQKGVVVTHTDISQRKSFEDVMEAAEDRLRQITDAVPVLISYVDKNGFYRFNNRTYENWFGYSHDEIYGKHMSEVLGSAAWEKVHPRVEATLAGQEVSYEDFLEYKNAGARWVNVTYTPLRDKTGEVQGLAVLVADITDRKETESQLRRNEEKFRLLFEKSLDAILIADDEGRYIDINQAACEMLGYSREQLLKMKVSDLPTPNETDIEHLYRSFVKKGKEKGEFNFVRADGKPRTAQYSATRISEGRNLSIMRDVTEQKQLVWALRESEERHRILFEKNPFPVFVIETGNHQILAVNEAAEKLYGYGREELLKMSALDLRPPEEIPGYLDVMKRVSEQEAVNSIQVKHRKKNGEIIEVELSSYKLDYFGRQARYIILADVTQRNRLEEEKSRTQREKLQILESITDAFVSLDCEWRYVYVNPVAERELGKSSDELLGKCLWEVFPEAIRTIAYPEYQRAMVSKTASHFELFFEPFGNWLEINAYPSETGLSIYWRNINERKQAEEIIREKAELLEQTYDAVIIWKLDDGIISWNPSAEQLYGYKEVEAIEKHTHELLKTVYPKPYSAFFSNLREKSQWEGELIHTTKEGREIIVESRFATIKKSDGDVIVLETCRDITERKRFEAEMNRVTQLSLVGELAAGLAHEIKNPLAGIKGVIDILLQRRAPDDDEREILGSVRHEIERIDETVRALLNQARPKPLELKPASLTETIRRSVQFAFHQNNVHHPDGGKTVIEMDIPDEELVIPHDSSRLEDALLNLILNAIEATADKTDGRITVRLSRIKSNNGNSEVLIAVSDNGCGISEQMLKEIFAPFFTTTKDGTGLGLAAVKRIARAHGGSCDVVSTVGQGSTFTIHLPVNDPDGLPGF